jgi:type I restriction enzyme S subunit
MRVRIHPYAIFANESLPKRLRNLQTKEFLSQSVPIPPLAIQRAVAGYLDRLEIGKDSSDELPAELAEQRRIVARIEEFAAKVEEARNLRQKAEEEAEALLDSITQQSLGEIGARCSLGDGLFELIYRYPTFYDIDYTESGVGLLKIGNLTQDKWDIDFKKQCAFISQETSLKFSRTILAEGDLIMAARGATIGKTAYVTQDFAGFNINANLLRLKPNPKKLNGRFFWYFMCSPFGQDQFQALVTSTAKETVTVPKLKTMLVPLPPLPEQHRIVAYLDDLQKQTDALHALQTETCAELDALMPSIMDKAFRGEL